MIKVHITKDSEVAKYRCLGVKESEKTPEWAADKNQMPFNQREYGHQWKTIVRGSKKRA